MKKLILIFSIFMLSGCLTNKDFSTKCSYNTLTAHLSNDIIYEIIYDADDVVKEAIITKKYKALDDEGKSIVDSIKNGIDDFNKKYSDSGIKYLTQDDDGFIITYDIPVTSLSDDLLNEFKLNKNSVKLFNSFKKEKIECED